MTERRYDLDWLRIAAFAVLILYHVGMFYVSWDWHVKSSRASDAIEPLMLLVNPWRLTLLFLISGAATRFMADKMSAGKLAASRLGRLLPPLVLAVFVVVPPQTYYEIVEAVRALPPDLAARYAGATDNFYLKYVTASGDWCDGEGCLITPTYNHMWFVAYLVVYTLALILLLPLLRRVPRAVAAAISGAGFILTPWLFMAALRIALYPVFGETHNVFDDPYLHLLYFSVFLFGFAVAKHGPFFDACVRWRWRALAIALCCWAAIAVYSGAYSEAAPPSDWLRTLMRAVRELDAWCAIVAVIGFAHRHLRTADGPIRRWLTAAIFPFYLIHQTVIVVAGHHLDPLGLPLWLEASLLIGATLAGCLAFYALGRTVPQLRVWVGLPSKTASNHANGRALAAGEAR